MVIFILEKLKREFYQKIRMVGDSTILIKSSTCAINQL